MHSNTHTRNINDYAMRCMIYAHNCMRTDACGGIQLAAAATIYNTSMHSVTPGTSDVGILNSVFDLLECNLRMLANILAYVSILISCQH
jgi:hypothetical protein